MTDRMFYWVLTIICCMSLLIGVLTENVWSLIVAVGVACLGLVLAGSRLQAPHAEEYRFGSLEHKAVYENAIKRQMKRIAYYRVMQKTEGPDIGPWYEKYDRAKVTYSLLYDRYYKAGRKYGWK